MSAFRFPARLGTMGRGERRIYVTDKTADLRRHAKHCRDMAHGQADDRVRTILQTMASELDDQADTIESGERKPPRA